MLTNSRALSKSLVILAFATAIGLAACDTQGITGQKDNADASSIDGLQANSEQQQSSCGSCDGASSQPYEVLGMTQVGLSDSKEGSTLELSVLVEEKGSYGTAEGLPDEIYVLQEGKRVGLTDKGQKSDEAAGDGVYTAVVESDDPSLGSAKRYIPGTQSQPPEKLSHNYNRELNEEPNLPEVSCTLDVVSPGHECEGHGECPEESILGGDTWFCVCVSECEVTVF